MNVDEEVLRFARLLESVVRVSKVSVRELERRLDLGGGTLNRIFSGRIELKLRHILAVLDALGIDPREYFKSAYKDVPPTDPPRPLPDSFLHALELFAPPGLRPERAVVAISDEEFERRVAAALKNLDAVLPKPKRKRKRKTAGGKGQAPAGKGKAPAAARRERRAPSEGKPRRRRPKAPPAEPPA